MDPQVNALYTAYLDHTGGDKAAAASLTLAAVMQSNADRVEATLPDQMLTVIQAAKRLQLSTATVYARCMAGSLRSVRVGRAIRIPVEALTEQPRSTTPRLGRDYLS